jgi:hypothetical protein
MRVRLRGINSYTAKLADGTTKTYWYAWKGGPRLLGEPGTPEFIASYNDAAAQKVKPPKGVLLSVMQGYQASEDFRQLADSTRRSSSPTSNVLKRNLPSSHSLLLRIGARAACLWSGATILQGIPVAAKQITLGQYWPVFCHGP